MLLRSPPLVATEQGFSLTIPHLFMPSSKPKIVNRLTCPFCDNDSEFFEIAEDALVTTYFKQNQDCSFTADDQNTEILGSVRLFCGNCGESLDDFHERFREMTF
jgi:hypothetical protein